MSDTDPSITSQPAPEPEKVSGPGCAVSPGSAISRFAQDAKGVLMPHPQGAYMTVADHLKLMKGLHPYNPAHPAGTCEKCGGEMIYNVPRLGPGGGYIHKKSMGFDCDTPNNEITNSDPTEP